MPLKKDATGKRWVELELLVSGTPEQVWHALATGEGYAGWFVPGEIEPKVGGVFKLDFGQGVFTQGVVTQWEPPHQFGYVEREWEQGAPPVATEITITARSGERCLVRMVHSLFTSSDSWDDQLEGFERGWPGYFAVLRVYLLHYCGQPAASFTATAVSKGAGLDTWRRLCEELGLSGACAEETRASTAEPEAWSGKVEHIQQDAEQRYALLNLVSPPAGVALVSVHVRGGQVHVGICRYLYGPDARERAAVLEAAWRQWLKREFE